MHAVATLQVEAATDDVYTHFLERVSEGRHLSLEATRAIAKGRGWSGATLPAQILQKGPVCILNVGTMVPRAGGMRSRAAHHHHASPESGVNV